MSNTQRLNERGKRKRAVTVEELEEVEIVGGLVCPPDIPYGLHWTPVNSLHSQVYPYHL